MVDPFFQQAGQSQGQNPQGQGAQQPSQNNSQVAQKVDSVLNQQQIQQILQQQQLLQQQYNQLATMLQNPQIPDTQKQQIYQQAQQISTQYQQNNKDLEVLGYNPNQVTKPVVTKKSRAARFSTKKVLIGCLVAFVLLAGGIAAMFYYIVSNPAQLASTGMDAETTKNLLQIFAIIFFGLIVIIAFGMLVVNGYRLATVKNTSKTKYGIGLFFGAILLIGGAVLGGQAISMINNISVDSSVDSNRLVSTSVYIKGGTISTSTPGLKLIAPSVIELKLNSTYFNGQVLPTLGQVKFNKVELDCGNGQIINMNMSTVKFEGDCTYFKKGNYDLNLKIDYTNSMGERLTKDIPAGTLNFESEISIEPVDGNLRYNDAKTELIVGRVPAKVRFDASRVFSDFSLPNYRVIWDVDGDGEMDKENEAIVVYTYNDPKFYTGVVRFPELNNYAYVFPVRVEQSDVPICEVLYQNVRGTNYAFDVRFLDLNFDIIEYQYSVLSSNKSIFNTKSKQSYFEYEFPSKGTYALRVDFITDDGKKGYCESDDIEIGATAFDINYSLQYKSVGSPRFVDFMSSGLNSFADDVLIVSEIPTVIKLELTSVIPNNPNAKRSVYVDDKHTFSSDSKTFEFTIDSMEERIVKIVVEDETTGARSEKSFVAKTNVDSIISRVLVIPDSSGISPFTVKFDASTTTLSDNTDEIVYFSWDFGDGNVKKNLSQAIVEHTYNYDKRNEEGVYWPKLTIFTKKGISKSIELEQPITVKQPVIQANIILTSHPGQQARVGDRVQMELVIDGMAQKIYRDFGNSKELECDPQTCKSTSTSYDVPGDYTIKVKAVFDDMSEANGSIKIKVN